MDRDRWERLKPLFQGAIEQPASTRADWLRRQCPDDEAIRAEVIALIEAHDTAAGFLESAPTFEPDPLDDLTPFDPAQGRPLGEGTQVGPYVIRGELGRGGMGIVYLAEDVRLGRTVALKALPAVLAGDHQRRERLRREARAAAALTHPGIAVVYALEEIAGDLFIASEHVKGRTLKAVLAEGPLGPERALDVALGIVSALAAAHEAGIVHRDLKPENILCTEDGRPKILDFGIAHFTAGALTQLTLSGAVLGTPAYMAPEQLVGADVDARADVYAVGVLLFEMATGRHPLSDPRNPGTSEPPNLGPPEPRNLGTLEPRIKAIVDRAMARDPRERYASARELLAALEDARGRAAGARPDVSARRWWWEFHQGMAALVYWLMAIPAWRAKNVMGGLTGRAFFIVVLTAIIVAANLRLHLWFTSRFYPEELTWVRARTHRWITAADWLFVLTLVAGGLLAGETDGPLATLLQGVGIGSAVAFLVIEPVTERAAFRE